MASVVTLELILNRPQGDDYRKVQYKFTLLDNLNQNHFVTYPPKTVPTNWDTDAEMLAMAPQVLADKGINEQVDLREQAKTGAIVLHDDLGGYYGKKTLLWDTWDSHTTEFLKYWLSLENQLELVNVKADLDLISNTDLKNLLDIAQSDTTDIRASVQVAIDTKATLDSYSPYYDEDGNWVVA